MPLYDYHCANCGHEEEIQHSIKAKPITVCPVCNQSTFSRRITGGLEVQVKEINTIGKLADHNTKKNKSRIEDECAAKEEAKSPEQKRKEAKQKLNKEIGRMNSKQLHDYIMTGDK